METLVRDWPDRLPSPRLLTDKRRLPLEIEVDFPERVGIDRLLNAVAANAIRDLSQPAIIVNSGTAVTVDLVGGEGAFLGGAILPGILLSAKALHAETTTLPHVDPWKLLKDEPPVLGKNTEAAIASGLYWGHLGAVRELVGRLMERVTAGEGEPLRSESREAKPEKSEDAFLEDLQRG
jgi:type III pantothenate kinase